jgi:hypothetical protein
MAKSRKNIFRKSNKRIKKIRKSRKNFSKMSGGKPLSDEDRDFLLDVKWYPIDRFDIHLNSPDYSSEKKLRDNEYIKYKTITVEDIESAIQTYNVGQIDKIRNLSHLKVIARNNDGIPSKFSWLYNCIVNIFRDIGPPADYNH